MTQQAPKWLPYIAWAPVLIYFGVKYLVIGSDRITGRQSMFLLAAVVLAEIALWQYRKQFHSSQTQDDGTDGTDGTE